MTNPESPKSDTSESDSKKVCVESIWIASASDVHQYYVPYGVARSLERRLNDAMRERDEHKWQAEKLTDTLQSVLRAYEGSLPDPERFEVSTDTKNRLAFIQDLWNKFIAKRK